MLNNPNNQINRSPIEVMIEHLARLPGLGPKSARRVGLHLIRNSATSLEYLVNSMLSVQKHVITCEVCGNVDVVSPCSICTDTKRNSTTICVVKEVGELWAIEQTGNYKGMYHVLGGLLSGIDRVGPEDLAIDTLLNRIAETNTIEVIIGLSATFEGQTTSHYLASMLNDAGVSVTKLAQGVPIGGELDYLDSGTLSAAINDRQPML